MKQQNKEEIEMFEKINERQLYLDKNSGIEFLIPKDFLIDEETGELMNKKGKVLSKIPIFITKVIENIDDDIEKVELQIEKKGVVKRKDFLKSTVYGSPMELANFGVPITNVNKDDFITYLSQLENDNCDNIPTIKAVSRLGWREKEGKQNQVFVPYSENSGYIIDKDNVQKNYIEAYTEQKGDLKEWIKVMTNYREKNSVFRLIIATAFSSPLLKLVGCRNFVLYNYENSKSGKTSASMAAISAFGNPDKLHISLNTTKVALELLLSYNNNLPVAIQEKSIINSDKDLEQLAYMLGEGIRKSKRKSKVTN